MDFPVRYIAMGAAVGVALSVGFAFAEPAPVKETVLDLVPDNSPQGFDTSRLVKFDDKHYAITYDASVSTDVLSATTIKKIEAGRVSYVSIGTTSTGTYSSDALTSKHIQYPGIAVREVWRDGSALSVWRRGYWVGINSLNAKSIVSVRNGALRVRSDRTRTCISSATLRVC
jgi:hypothetical protein